MSNLIPEKRVDKNGVLTTKHVRSGPKTPVVKSSLPAPALTPKSPTVRKAKKPTKAQLETNSRSFRTSRYDVDPKLLASLKLRPAPLYLAFMVSDTQFYDVLSVTSDSNAIALMHAGITSSKEAVDHLESKGLSGLIRHRDCAAEALERRVPPEIFMREGNNIQDMDTEHNPLFMDSLETAGILALNGNFSWDVRKGTIKLSDIKAIGATRIKQADSWPLLAGALRKIASGEAHYTTDDVKFVISYYSPITRQIEDALEIADYYGSGVIQKLKGQNSHIFDFFRGLKDSEPDRERSAEIFLYASTVVKLGGVFDKGISQSVNEITRFFDAGISPEDVAAGTITVNQVEAIKEHGINPSVSGGWL